MQLFLSNHWMPEPQTPTPAHGLWWVLAWGHHTRCAATHTLIRVEEQAIFIPHTSKSLVSSSPSLSSPHLLFPLSSLQHLPFPTPCHPVHTLYVPLPPPPPPLPVERGVPTPREGGEEGEGTPPPAPAGTHETHHLRGEDGVRRGWGWWGERREREIGTNMWKMERWGWGILMKEWLCGRWMGRWWRREGGLVRVRRAKGGKGDIWIFKWMNEKEWKYRVF